MMIKGILRLVMGGGIYVLIVISNLNAIELSSICNDANNCTLYENYSDITNHSNFNGGIQLNQKTITNLTNYSTLGNIAWGGGTITHITNYGTMGVIDGIRAINPTPTTMSVTNYGIMGGIETEYGDKDIFIANYGTINPTSRGRHFEGNNSYYFVFIDYAMRITESASVFANSKGDTSGNNNSHIVFSNSGQVKFDNPNSKIILNFGGNFEFGVAYPLDKLIINTSGQNKLQVDFERLTTKSSLYKLTQNGENFIVSLDAPNSEIGILYKSNIRTMNNFYTISNSMIYPRKYSKSQNLGRKISSLQDFKPHPKSLPQGEGLAFYSPSLTEGVRGWVEYPLLLDSAFSLKSYELFAYKNESQNLQTRRIKRPNKRNYSRNLKDSSLRDSAKQNRGNPKDLRAKRSNHPPQNLNADSAKSDYYFVLIPFINHNYFFESGRYNLSGFDYGFLTAFSARVAESNSFGAHFMMSYGNLSDSHDKNFHISNLNLNLGLNYKLDLIYDMFLKVRGDVFYFLNALDSATLKNIKPNNFGFGASVLFGKEWDFKSGGVLGIEAGLDYKALKSNKVSVDSQEYQQALYNLIYADLGLNYQKYFGGFGINLGGGFKANLAPKLAKSTLLANSQNLRFVLDNDKYLGYANVALSYILNHKSFDMEFSLAYYGNFGDRAISNGGGFEWRVGW